MLLFCGKSYRVVSHFVDVVLYIGPYCVGGLTVKEDMFDVFCDLTVMAVGCVVDCGVIER